MAKILECAKVDPSSGCQHVVRGETEEEILTKAAEHAKEHGIREVTPELIERVKPIIRDQRVTFLFAPLARAPACGPILPQPAPSARRPNILRALHRQVMT